MSFGSDFNGCKFQAGDHVVPKDLHDNSSATIWEVRLVALKHGGTDYYHCVAPGYGSIHAYEKDIVKVDLPVSDFFKKKHIEMLV